MKVKATTATILQNSKNARFLFVLVRGFLSRMLFTENEKIQHLISKTN